MSAGNVVRRLIAGLKSRSRLDWNAGDTLQLLPASHGGKLVIGDETAGAEVELVLGQTSAQKITLGPSNTVTMNNVQLNITGASSALYLPLGQWAVGGTQVIADGGEINRAADSGTRVITYASATVTLSAASNENRVAVANRANGIEFTLPAADSSAVGSRYTIIIGTKVTSNDFIVKVANASDIMVGYIFAQSASGNNCKVWPSAAVAGADMIRFDRGTKGTTDPGQYVQAVCIATNVWSVFGVTAQTATEANPFESGV